MGLGRWARDGFETNSFVYEISKKILSEFGEPLELETVFGKLSSKQYLINKLNSF